MVAGIWEVLRGLTGFEVWIRRSCCCGLLEGLGKSSSELPDFRDVSNRFRFVGRTPREGSALDWSCGEPPLLRDCVRERVDCLGGIWRRGDRRNKARATDSRQQINKQPNRPEIRSATADCVVVQQSEWWWSVEEG